VEELDWPAQSPDLNPIKHLWDELEYQLRARPNHPTSVPNLTNALVAEWKKVPRSNVATSSGKTSQKSVIIAKGGPTPWNEMFDEQASTYFWLCSVH
jgi:hypothetical protein